MWILLLIHCFYIIIFTNLLLLLVVVVLVGNLIIQVFIWTVRRLLQVHQKEISGTFS